MKKQALVSLVGWYGVFAILLAYGLISFNLISAHTATYQLLNLSGAIGLIVEASSKHDIQPAAINIVWAIIAIVALCGLVIHL